MCVYKNHAFIYFLRPPSWSGTVTPRCFHHHGFETPWWWIHPGVDLNWFTKIPASAKYTKEPRLPCDLYTREPLLPGLFVIIIFCKPVLMFVSYIYTKKLTPGHIHHGESRLSAVFTTGELRLSKIFITREFFWTPGSHFTNFQEHTTIFKGTIILKIDCRLLSLLRDMWFIVETIALAKGF